MQSRTAEILRFPSPAEEPPSLAPGALVADRFRIEAIYGKGAYSVVYRALDTFTGSDIALKVLRKDTPSTSAIARLRRQLAVSQHIASPHLVRVHDVFEADDLVFIVMEAVNGVSLEERLAKGRPSVEDTLQILAEVLSGLAALHSLAIAHRDIKPANILLGPHGRVKLGDLGLAGPSESGTSGAEEGIIGTVDYIAPEQVLGLPVTYAADLYALGVVAFECLTGRSPHEGSSAMATLIRRVNEGPANPRKFDPTIPHWLGRLVQSLLRRDASERPPSAEWVLEQIRRPRPLGALAQFFRERLKFLTGEPQSFKGAALKDDNEENVLGEALRLLSESGRLLVEANSSTRRLEATLDRNREA